jgi:hypothetical protein
MIETIIGESIMNWLKSRLKERTTLDGAILIVVGLAMILAPINLIAYGAMAYGAWTIWKAE